MARGAEGVITITYLVVPDPPTPNPTLGMGSTVVGRSWKVRGAFPGGTQPV